MMAPSLGLTMNLGAEFITADNKLVARADRDYAKITTLCGRCDTRKLGL